MLYFSTVGFSNKRGKIWGLSRHSSPHFSDWEAMQPLVECDNDVMTLTVSGQGFSHLQVDRSKVAQSLMNTWIQHSRFKR